MPNNQNEEGVKIEVTAKAVEEHVHQWRIDSIEGFNETLAGRSLYAQEVYLERIARLECDMKQVLSYVELLARLLAKHEKLD